MYSFISKLLIGKIALNSAQRHTVLSLSETKHQQITSYASTLTHRKAKRKIHDPVDCHDIIGIKHYLKLKHNLTKNTVISSTEDPSVAATVSLNISTRVFLLKGSTHLMSKNFKNRYNFDGTAQVSVRNMSGQGNFQDSEDKKQLNQRFLDCAARGDLEDFKVLLGVVDIDIKSDRGWTALMFAARNGHTPIISSLIEKGCDVNCLNASGQTALDIAQFWNYNEAVAILSQHRQLVEFDQIHNYYSLNPLYRASDLRKDPSALETAKKNPSAKFVVFLNSEPYLLESLEKKRKFKFAVFNLDQLPANFSDKTTVIFLGLETWDPDSSPWFAVELRQEDATFTSKYYPDGKFVVPFPTTMQMTATHAGIFAEAHSILCWLDRYKYCPTCGSKQTVAEGGYKQICNNPDCSSHKGVHNTCYPRVDPSLIMLVLSPDKKRCLLGRQKRFPPKMFSCLAGFMEPGESIEDTCRREIEEESGIKVGRVDYHSSQPWPFPATLMLGCIAHARTDTIVIDKDELEEARWFSHSEVAQMLAQLHPDGIFVPPSQAIAHQLIKSWVISHSANL